MNGLIILFCLAILAFNVYLLYLQLRMSNDIHAMRYLFTTLFKEEVKKKVTEENIRKTKEAQKPVITAPGINTQTRQSQALTPQTRQSHLLRRMT